MTIVSIGIDGRRDLWGYPTVIFTLHIQRRHRYYVVNLIIPCCLLSFIAVATFLLEPSSDSRLGIGTYAFFVITL